MESIIDIIKQNLHNLFVFSQYSFEYLSEVMIDGFHFWEKVCITYEETI